MVEVLAGIVASPPSARMLGFFELAGAFMKKFLLATTAIVAFAAQVQFGHADDGVSVGYVDLPTTFISFEGGYYLNASPENASFDREDPKLGDLSSLQPGTGGAQGRFELGQRLNENWDYRVGFAAILLGTDSTRDSYEFMDNNILVAGESEASQKTNLQILDVEFGYRPDDIGQLQTRLFAGVRGLHSKTELDWEADEDKVGNFSDEVYAIGPRLGVDFTVPLDTQSIALVGSASGSLLLGNIKSVANSSGGGLDGPGQDSSEWNDSPTIWNLEAMAGVSFGVGENADLTLGYRVARFGDMVGDRSDIDKAGDFSNDAQSDLLLHGPFARITVEIP